METKLYRNNRNENKFIEVRRYGCGHYVWKQSIRHPEVNVINYNGYSLKRSHVGVWHRQRKGTIQEVLKEYNEVRK